MTPNQRPGRPRDRIRIFTIKLACFEKKISRQIAVSDIYQHFWDLKEERQVLMTPNQRPGRPRDRIFTIKLNVQVFILCLSIFAKS